MDLTIVTDRSELPSSLREGLERLGVRHALATSLSGIAPDSDYALTTGAESEAITPELLAALWARRGEAEVVIASRHHRGGRSLSRLANRAFRRALDLPLDDVTGSVRLYRVPALRHLSRPSRDGDTAPARMEMLVRLYNEGYKIKEIPAEGLGASETGLVSAVASLPRLRRLRTSRTAADNDDRAFSRGSRLRQRWLDHRQATIVSYLEVDVPVLDVGCGTGRLVQTLSKGVGLDNAMKKLRFLRGRAKTLVGGDVRKLPFRDASFPQLVCSDLGDTAPSFDELRRILKPRGTLVIGTPDRASFRRRLLAPIAGLGGGARIDEPGLRSELEAGGFRVDEVRRVYGAEMIVRAVRSER